MNKQKCHLEIGHLKGHRLWVLKYRIESIVLNLLRVGKQIYWFEVSLHIYFRSQKCQPYTDNRNLICFFILADHIGWKRTNLKRHFRNIEVTGTRLESITFTVLRTISKKLSHQHWIMVCILRVQSYDLHSLLHCSYIS